MLCLHVFCQARPPQRVDCLASKWETALSVFPKDTATRYRIAVSLGKTLNAVSHFDAKAKQTEATVI